MNDTTNIKTSSMYNKNYRDVKALVKLLFNRSQNDMAKMIVEFLASKEIITQEEANNIEEITNWAGSFWFFAKSRFDAKCIRCRKDCNKGKPICLTFNNEPFCIACLTKEEKATPNAAYKRFIEGVGQDVKKVIVKLHQNKY